MLGRTLPHGGTALEPLQVATPRLLRISPVDEAADGETVDLSGLLRGKTVWCQDGNSLVIEGATKVPTASRLLAMADVVQWDFTGAPIRTFCTGDEGAPPTDANYVAVAVAKVETLYRIETLAHPSASHEPCRVDEATGFHVRVGADGAVMATHTGWSDVRVHTKDLFCADAELWLRAHCPEEPDDKACSPDWFGLAPVY